MFKTIYDEEEKIWTGLCTVPLFNRNLSVGQAILNSLKLNPNKIGQISDNNGVMLTNIETKTKTENVAQNLLKMGFKGGDVIAVIAKNHHYVAPVVFACLTIGTPVNTLDPTFKPNEMSHILQLSQPKLIFCDSNNVLCIRESLKLLKLTVPIFTFGEKVDGARMVEELLVGNENEEIFCPPNLSDGVNTIAAILCSSGTTGSSKTVSLTHAAILQNIVSSLTITTEDIMLCFSSLYWLSGFGTLITGTIKGATRVITTEPFSPELFIQIVEKYNVTSALSSPTYVALLLQSDKLCKASLTSIKRYWCGGSSVSKELCEKMNKYLTNGILQNSYGMTEIAGLLSVNISKHNLKTVGRLYENSKVKLINADGRNCGVNECGEICCLPMYPFLGYYSDEENTKQLLDEDGWIQSGDIGYFDEEGYLYIVDRKKDIMKYMNYQISPSEIEDIILTCEGVANVCVVGISDPIKIDLPAAVVVRKLVGAKITAEEIKDLVKDTFSDFKQLRGGVFFVDSLPMTPSGKVIRRKVTDLATECYNNKASLNN